MRQDNEIDQLFRDASKVNGLEEIPSVFLTDLNTRLDVLEKKRKKPIAFWWLFGVFSISLFALGTTLFYTSAGNEITENKDINLEKEKSVVVNEEATTFDAQTENEISGTSNSSTKNSKNLFTKNSISNKEKTLKNEPIKSSSITKLNSSSDLISENQLIENSTMESNQENINSTNENETENNNTQVIDSVLTKDSVQTNEIIQKIEFTKEKKQLSITKEIGFFTGVSNIFSSFDIPSELENNTTVLVSEYRETRDREEVSTTSWDFSIRMKWVINNFSVQTGLDFFQWGEEIRYEYNSISGINRYGYLAIPLNLGYSKTWNKFGINPFAGVMFGYGMNRTGNYLQPDLNSIAQASSKKYLGNYQLACEFFFLSESQFKLSFTPIYRGSFKEVVFTDLIRNRYKSIGLQLGISYNF